MKNSFISTNKTRIATAQTYQEITSKADACKSRDLQAQLETEKKAGKAYQSHCFSRFTKSRLAPAIGLKTRSKRQ